MDGGNVGDQNILQCSSCGAHLTEGVRKGKITCPYCGTVNVFKQQVKADGMLICSNCGAANQPEAEYCEECGQGLYLICPKCGMKNRSDAAHCSKCGTRLGDEIKLRNLYYDYLSEAKRVQKKFQRKMWPWYLSLIPTIFAIIMNIADPFHEIGLVFFSIFVFSIPAIVLLPIGTVSSRKKSKKAAQEVEAISANRIGFGEFYDLYAFKHYWTMGMVEGEKRERFLSIVEMK